MGLTGMTLGVGMILVVIFKREGKEELVLYVCLSSLV